MEILNEIVNRIKSMKKYRLMDLPDWGLLIYGTSSFLVAGYWGLVLSNIVPDFVKEVNKIGISPTAVMVGLILGLLSLKFWLFGCIATRCHALIYDRWFK
ncbi:MAG: hypothetical protein NPIRA02_11860 [Nitrospirales bacterium]|nr:MAG: hypothetical protein NPIRA02_11860 [Nitrospirales bacterium]